MSSSSQSLSPSPFLNHQSWITFSIGWLVAKGGVGGTSGLSVLRNYFQRLQRVVEGNRPGLKMNVLGCWGGKWWLSGVVGAVSRVLVAGFGGRGRLGLLCCRRQKLPISLACSSTSLSSPTPSPHQIVFDFFFQFVRF